MAHYMNFSYSMLNECAINNGSVVNVYNPPSHIMFGSGTHGGHRWDGVPLGTQGPIARNRDGGAPRNSPPRDGSESDRLTGKGSPFI